MTMYEATSVRVELPGNKSQYVKARTYGGLMKALGYDWKGFRFARKYDATEPSRFASIRTEDANALTLFARIVR